LLLVQALIVASASASVLHVHEYAGHDHPDHRHGPAAHTHAQSTAHDHDRDLPAGGDHGATIESAACEPGRHAVGARMAADIRLAQVDVGELPARIAVAAAATICAATALTDVRVHGPPLDDRIASRAPPLISHA
jgi:hypothetical protein